MLSAVLSAASIALYSADADSSTVPPLDQLDATAQLLGRINALALAATSAVVCLVIWQNDVHECVTVFSDSLCFITKQSIRNLVDEQCPLSNSQIAQWSCSS